MTKEAGEKTPEASSILDTLKPPRGTHDILPPDSESWHLLEKTARALALAFGFREIRIPIFEHTELFKRSVGETTDIVNKEMYSFTDRSNRSLSLRPEGTAGVVRAFLNGGLHRLSPPVKLFYMGPMFRYEATQTGRQRQFHQIGIEAFGSQGPLIDAEVISLADCYLRQIGLTQVEIQLNSIGCPQCRPPYKEKLKAKLLPTLTQLCTDCQDRFKRNPLRMLDCKSNHCQAHYQDAPIPIEHLCTECNSHWHSLLAILGQLKIDYTINNRLVRGLDYYTRTVVEVVTPDPRLGGQSTILAGGRYDNLVESFGGPQTPAVGWAIGLERLQLLLGQKIERPPLAFVVSNHQQRALVLANELRKAGIFCELDFPAASSVPRSFTKQLQQANKLGIMWAIIVGDDELASGEVTLKNMQDGSQKKIAANQLVEFFKSYG